MILFTFVLYGFWFLLSSKKGVLIRAFVLSTHINGFVSFRQILICNYRSIIVLCIFTIFCEQENVFFFSFNIPYHDLSQKLALTITLCMWQKYAPEFCEELIRVTLWRLNSFIVYHKEHLTKYWGKSLKSSQIALLIQYIYLNIS